MLLQFLHDTFSDPSSFYPIVGIGSGLGATVGSVVTMAVSKALNKKKDNADINVINYDVIDKQFKTVWDNLKQQSNIIKELQGNSCYREPCNIRINGNNIPEPKKTKTKSAS